AGSGWGGVGAASVPLCGGAAPGVCAGEHPVEGARRLLPVARRLGRVHLPPPRDGAGCRTVGRDDPGAGGWKGGNQGPTPAPPRCRWRRRCALLGGADAGGTDPVERGIYRLRWGDRGPTPPGSAPPSFGPAGVECVPVERAFPLPVPFLCRSPVGTGGEGKGGGGADPFGAGRADAPDSLPLLGPLSPSAAGAGGSGGGPAPPGIRRRGGISRSRRRLVRGAGSPLPAGGEKPVETAASDPPGT